MGEHLRQAQAEVEARRAPVPDRLVLRRDREDGVAVRDRLAQVPGRGDDGGREHDDGERTPGARGGECEDDRGERPQRERTHELPEAEHDARGRGDLPAVVLPPEQARGEEQRDRRQQHRERLGVEHRADAKHDR